MLSIRTFITMDKYNNFNIEYGKNFYGDGLVYLQNFSKLSALDPSTLNGLEGGVYSYMDYSRIIKFDEENEYKPPMGSSSINPYYNSVIKEWNPALVSGRLPETSRVDGKIEVIVTEGFYHLNDTFTASFTMENSKREYIVVGMFAEKFYFLNSPPHSSNPDDEILSAGSFTSADSFYKDRAPYVIASMEDVEFAYKDYESKNILLNFNSEYYTEHKSEIKSLLSEYGAVLDFDDMYDNAVKEKKSIRLKELIKFISFTVIGLILITINLILLFKKSVRELAIHYLSGYSIGKIFGAFLSYIVSLAILPTILYVAMTLFKFSGKSSLINYGFLLYLPAIAVSLLFILVSLAVICVFFCGKTINKITAVDET